MTKINVHEAKTHLSRYLKRALKGERIVVCNRNVPIIEFTPVGAASKKRRPRIGGFKGEVSIPKGFWDPLPDEVLRAFQGLGE